MAPHPHLHAWPSPLSQLLEAKGSFRPRAQRSGHWDQSCISDWRLSAWQPRSSLAPPASFLLLSVQLEWSDFSQYHSILAFFFQSFHPLTAGDPQLKLWRAQVDCLMAHFPHPRAWRSHSKTTLKYFPCCRFSHPLVFVAGCHRWFGRLVRLIFPYCLDSSG